MVARIGQTVDGTMGIRFWPRTAARSMLTAAKPVARAAQETGRKQIPMRIADSPTMIAPTPMPNTQNRPIERHGREQRLLPPVRGQVVNRQGHEDQCRQG